MMILILAAFLAAPLPSQNDVNPTELAVAGEKPASIDEKVHVWFERSLRDADSAKIEEMRGPRLAVRRYTQGFLKKTAPAAWYVCYRVNAKNAYGAYTGWQAYMFAFRNGEIVGAMNNGNSRYDENIVLAECNTGIDGAGTAF